MRAVALSVLLLAACRTPPPPPPPTPPPPEATRAQAAFRLLQQRLGARLQEQLKAGGPASAVGVCRDEAPRIAAEIGREQGFELGRTSHRLRNPANAPRAWARPHVESAGPGAPAPEPVVVPVDGARVGVLQPIVTGTTCLACHGPAENLAPGVKAALSAAYPEDRATGFAAGDLRGFFWAEVPTAR